MQQYTIVSHLLLCLVCALIVGCSFSPDQPPNWKKDSFTYTTFTTPDNDFTIAVPQPFAAIRRYQPEKDCVYCVSTNMNATYRGLGPHIVLSVETAAPRIPSRNNCKRITVADGCRVYTLENLLLDTRGTRGTGNIGSVLLTNGTYLTVSALEPDPERQFTPECVLRILKSAVLSSFIKECSTPLLSRLARRTNDESHTDVMPP